MKKFLAVMLLLAAIGCQKSASFESITGEYRVDTVKSLDIIKQTDRYKALPREKQVEVESMFASVVKNSKLILAKDKMTVFVEGRQVAIPITSTKKTENGFEITSTIQPPQNQAQDPAKAPGQSLDNTKKQGPITINLGIKVDENRIQFFMAGNPGLSQHIWKKV